MATIRLLLLSAGTEAGQDILAMLAPRRADVTLVATSDVADEPALFDCDAVHLVAPAAADPDAFERVLLEVMERERIDLVVPCSDEDLVSCARARDRHPRLAPRLLCGSPEVANVLVDRWASHDFCKTHDLPYAASIVGTSADAQAAFVAAHGLPAIARPRRGAGPAQVILVSTPAQLATMLGRDGYLAQQFIGDREAVDAYLRGLDDVGVPLFHHIHGPTRSMHAIIAPDGRLVGLFGTRRVRQLRRSRWLAVDDDPAAIALGRRCANAFAAAGWRGPLDIECLADARGELRIQELRGRPAGASMDRWLLGFDPVGAAVGAFVGRTLFFDRRPATAPIEAFESRVPRAVDPAHVAVLARDHVWRRAA
jgi:hypothetical protein